MILSKSEIIDINIQKLQKQDKRRCFVNTLLFSALLDLLQSISDNNRPEM